MKQILPILFGYLLIFAPLPKALYGQEDCVLQPPVLRIDFGNNGNPADPNISSLENYQRVTDNCPQDGNYTIMSSIDGCFSGHWITMNQDHTAGDNGGQMLVVNAAYNPGVFFVTPLKGLSANTSYELGVWIVNVCKPEFECTDIRPDLRFAVTSASGKILAKFSTGEIAPTGRAIWMQYAAMFKTPAEPGILLLKIENKSNGGCGNDFAMDDITLRECIVPLPVVKEQPKPKPLVKPPVEPAKPVVKPAPPVLQPLKKNVTTITKTPVKNTPGTPAPVIKERHDILLPDPILTRANPVVKQIETTVSGIEIALYDNGEIDGDTVSIYHNNELVVSRAGLSAKPVTFHFNVDVTHPHHELVMVANNLGSIPPNTSLMIVTSKDKRYEVFISSTEQKNAKVVIDLKE